MNSEGITRPGSWEPEVDKESGPAAQSGVWTCKSIDNGRTIDTIRTNLFSQIEIEYVGVSGDDTAFQPGSFAIGIFRRKNRLFFNLAADAQIDQILCGSLFWLLAICGNAGVIVTI